MKKLFAVIALCLIILAIVYIVYYFTGDNSLLILFISLIGAVACIYIIGAIIWLLEYIGKN